MLEQFTFGDILLLHDKLVKNEEAETYPDLYTYLMVRPNCHQRFMALVDSADAGRSLSEVAVYRDVTPDNEEEMGYLDGQALSVSDHTEGGEVYSIKDEDTAELEVNENNAYRVEYEARAQSPLDQQSAAEANVTEEPDRTPEQNTDTSNDKNTTDDLIDYDDELDELDEIPSSKNGNSHPFPTYTYLFQCRQTPNCQCNSCFDLDLERLEASWRDESWTSIPSKSTAQNIHANYPKSDAELHATSPVRQHFHVPGPQPFGTLQIDTNTGHIQDQENMSLRHDTREARGESDAVATDINNENQHPSTPPNGTVDAPKSDVTSATATLTGDDKDEIDYTDDEEDNEKFGGKYTPPNIIPDAATKIKMPVDDEITWESDNEDAKTGPTPAPKQTVQVSPPSGKRPRSDSDTAENFMQQNGKHANSSETYLKFLLTCHRCQASSSILTLSNPHPAHLLSFPLSHPIPIPPSP